jgi:hypothetical protein
MRLLICAALLAASCAPALAASCTSRIAYVQRIIDKDVKTGFVDKKVHDDMGRDLAAATQACNAGNDAKAEQIISATQGRHGYPVR